jgi:hypothetical protein
LLRIPGFYAGTEHTLSSFACRRTNSWDFNACNRRLKSFSASINAMWSIVETTMGSDSTVAVAVPDSVVRELETGA